MKIKKAVLQTNHLNQTLNFYKNILECPIENETTNSFTLVFGDTLVEFTNRNVQGEPFYHFAFDIPSDQFSAAKEWALNRVTLSTEGGSDEVYFDTIHAYSFYFEDPSGNIVEFISRMDNNLKSDTPFSPGSIIQMSEISLVVQNKLHVANTLQKAGVYERNGNDIKRDSLSFMGNQMKPVYLLLVEQGRVWYFSDKKAVISPIEIIIDNDIKLKINDKQHFSVSTGYSQNIL